MDIRGFIETSFLDWDGKIASVVFLPHCNFRCPFCDNGPLIKNPEHNLPEVKLEAIDDFLSQRKDFIDGVVISGGEPTMQPWLGDLIRHFKEMDLLVKLDTNGTNPDLLSIYLSSHLLDYIAMDIKAPLNEKYQVAAGKMVDLNKIKESLKLIMNSGLDYEFRTTVVPTILDEPEIEELARSIAGAKKYALQQFVPDHTLDERLRAAAPHPKEKIMKMAELAKHYVPKTIVRGV